MQKASPNKRGFLVESADKIHMAKDMKLENSIVTLEGALLAGVSHFADPKNPMMALMERLEEKIDRLNEKLSVLTEEKLDLLLGHFDLLYYK